jgi:hypothetical protein
MIIGTPPVGRGEINDGFTFGPGGWPEALASRDDLTAEEIEAFAHNSADPPYEYWMLDAVALTDPAARKIMFQRFAFPADDWVSHREIVERPEGKQVAGGHGKRPLNSLIAVVNGAGDPFINHEFIRQVKYSNLWRQHCYELEGLKHAPFWGDSDRFIKLLAEFCEDAKIA